MQDSPSGGRAEVDSVACGVGDGVVAECDGTQEDDRIGARNIVSAERIAGADRAFHPYRTVGVGPAVDGVVGYAVVVATGQEDDPGTRAVGSRDYGVVIERIVVGVG